MTTFFGLNLRSALAERARRRAARADLSRLDERGLEDIGYNRADIELRHG